MQPRYARLDSFAAPARPRDQLWRVLAALALMGLAFVILTQSVLSVIEGVMGPFWSGAVALAMQGGRSPLGVIATLLGFVPLAFALALALRLLHDRPFASLFGPAGLTRRTALWVGGAALAMNLVLLPIQALSPEVGRHLTLAAQVPWALPALAGILVQAGTEEALFRGYLMQQCAVKSQSPLVWMGLPSAMFALLHLDPTAGQAEMVWSCGTAFLFGLAASDLTARTGTLGPAIGLHVAANVSGLLLVGLYGRMDGLALWNLVLNPMQPWAALPYIAIDMLGILVSWLLARLVLRV